MFKMNLSFLKQAIFVILCLASLQANAQVTDSIKKDLLTAPDTVKRLHSKPWALIPPAALMVYGALSFEFTPIRRLDFAINNEIVKTDPNFSTKAESYFQFAPIAIVYGLNLAGFAGKNTFIDRTALLALSGGFVAAAGYTLKYSTHRLRPNQSDYLSFPSGHTSTAFAGAEFLAQEYSDRSIWYGVAGYTIATATGVFRLYNRDHWFSDVVAGAGLGILSTKVSYLVYPYIRNALTHKNKDGKSTMLIPTYQEGMLGFSFAKQL